MVKIMEIRVKKVAELSPKAQKEVSDKLKVVPQNFNFQGYAKIVYGMGSPYEVISVDPIEGTIVDLFHDIISKLT